MKKLITKIKGTFPSRQETVEVLNYLHSKNFFALLLLVSIGIVTRFYAINDPNAVVFDEKYFVPIVENYTHGIFFIDPHPPTGKLILTLGSRLAGNKEYVSRETIENDGYPDTINIAATRVTPIMFGIFLIPVIYLLLFYLTKSKGLAMLGGLMVALDNGLIIQSKYVLFDSILLSFVFSSLLFSFWILDSKKNIKYLWLILSTFLAGLAFSTKYTGLAAVALNLLLIFRWNRNFWLFSGKNLLKACVRVLIAILIIVGVYLASYWIHFRLITHVGKGVEEFSQSFQNSLIQEDGSAPTEHISYWQKLKETQDSSARYENGVPELDLCKPEGEIGSAPSSWPFMGRGIPYYWRRNGDGVYSYIYFTGNPFVWFLGLLGTFSITSLFVASFFLRKNLFNWNVLFLFFGYLLNWIPLFFIKRVMYMYHYLIPLVFSILLFVLSIKIYLSLDETESTLLKKKKFTILLVMLTTLIVLSFFLYAPFTYGLNVSEKYVNTVNLLKIWNLKYLRIE